MQREFNSGTNQLPQSTIRSNPYDKNGKLKAGETQADRYGAFEIDSYDLETQTYTVKRPTADSLADAQVMFSVANLAASEVASFGMNGPFWCSLDTSGGTPSVGDDVGTQSGSYKLLKDNTGYKVLAYNATEERVLVRPFSSGGVADRRRIDLFSAAAGGSASVVFNTWTEIHSYTLTNNEASASIVEAGGLVEIAARSAEMPFAPTGTDNDTFADMITRIGIYGKSSSTYTPGDAGSLLTYIGGVSAQATGTGASAVFASAGSNVVGQIAGRLLGSIGGSPTGPSNTYNITKLTFDVKAELDSITNKGVFQLRLITHPYVAEIDVTP